MKDKFKIHVTRWGQFYIIKGVVFHINKIKIFKKLVWPSVDFFLIGHSVDLFVNILYVTKLCSDKFVSFWILRKIYIIHWN